MAGPPDDFNNQPPRHPDPMGGHPPADEPPTDPFYEDTEPTAWYRRPVVLILWGLSVLILIALIVYGIIELVEDQGTGSTPKTTTTTPHTTITTTTTTTTSPPPTTTTTTTEPSTTEPPTSSVVQPPVHEPTQQQPTRRRHWPSWLPTTIPAFP